MSNVIQIRDPQGNAVYPITDASLVIGLQDGPFSEYILSWDGSSTPVVANIPAGVSVVYNSTTYTGTLAASSSTACKVYLVASTSQVGEYDRYITSHTSSVYSWTPLASTQIQSPVVVDNLTTNDPTKALSAKQGKVLNEEVSQLGQFVNLQTKGVGNARNIQLTQGTSAGYDATKLAIEIPANTPVSFMIVDNNNILSESSDSLAVYFNGVPLETVDGHSVSEYEIHGYQGIIPKRVQTYIFPFKIGGFARYISGSYILRSGTITMSAFTITDTIKDEISELDIETNGRSESKQIALTAGTSVGYDATKTLIDIPANKKVNIVFSDHNGCLKTDSDSFGIYINGQLVEKLYGGFEQYEEHGYTGIIPNRKQTYTFPFKIDGFARYISGGLVLNSGTITFTASIDVNSLKDSVSTLGTDVSGLNENVADLDVKVDGISLSRSIQLTAGTSSGYDVTKMMASVPANTPLNVLFRDDNGCLQNTPQIIAVSINGEFKETIDGHSTMYWETHGYQGSLPNRLNTFVFPFAIDGVAMYISSSIIQSSGTITAEANVASIQNKIDKLKGISDGVSFELSRFENSAPSLYARDYIIDNCPYFIEKDNNPTSYNSGNYLDRRIAQVPRGGKHFIFFTDTHEQNANAGFHLAQILQYVKTRLGIDTVIFGGDIFEVYNGEGAPNYINANYQAASALEYYVSKYWAAFGKSFLWVCGNHDANSPGHTDLTNPDSDYLIPDFQLYERTTYQLNDSVTFNDNPYLIIKDDASIDADVKSQFRYWLKQNYYYDDSKNKVRYLVLDTRNMGQTSRRLDSTAVWCLLDFIYDALTNIEEGWDIVVCGHEWGRVNNGIPTPEDYYSSVIIEMLSAYKNKGTFTFTPYSTGREVAKKYWELKHGGAQTEVTYDFSAITWVGKIFAIGGHFHEDKSYISKPVTTTVSDGSDDIMGYDDYTERQLLSNEVLLLWRNRSAYSASAGLDGPSMVSGNITEYSFDVVTIKDDNTLSVIRIGINNASSENYNL